MKPVHQEVKEALIKRLQRLPLDTRLPSDRDLATEFNVAFLTINRVMNDLMREGYVVRRPRRGTFIASRERQVVNPGSGDGCVLVAYANYFSYHIFRHLRTAEELAQRGRLRLVEYKFNPESSADDLAAFAAGLDGLRGIMLMAPPQMLAPAPLARFDAIGIPVVAVSAMVEVGGTANCACVDADWTALGRLAAEALLDAGHQRLAWVNHEPSQPEGLARGMREALKARGRRGSDLVTVGQGVAAWSDARESGYRLAQQLIDEDLATGAVFTSISGARGALRALWERGLAAPTHLSLVAAGQQGGEEDYLTPPLTTVDADWTGEVRFAFDRILGAADERSRLLAPRLHRRGSIGPPRQAAR